MKKLLDTLVFLLCAVGTLTAQQPQTTRAPIAAYNAKYVNGTAPGYWVTPAVGLSVNVSPGTSFCSGSMIQYGGGALSLQANSANYIYLNTASNCVPAVKTSSFGTDDIPVGVVTAGPSGVSNIVDGRTMFRWSASSGGSSTTTTGGLWSSSTAYVSGSVVKYSGQTYLALQANTNAQPDTSTTSWSVIDSGGAAPVGPSNTFPAFVAGTGGTRNLGPTSIQLTGSSSDGVLVPGQIQSGTLSVVNTNCNLINGSFNGNVCVVTNNNSQSANGGVTSTLFQVTGAGRNYGNFPGVLYNTGWSHAQAHATTATFLSRGLHFMEGDNGNGMNCLSVGDCIYNYHYLNYIGGCCAASDEAVKNFAATNQEMHGFYRGTVATVTDNASPGANYPSGGHKITMLLNASTSVSGSNIVGDGTYLIGDPTVTGTTACRFNGFQSTWSGLPSLNLGLIPVTGCSGASIPTINAWGTATVGTDGNMIGDLPDSGSRTANVPGQQSFVITLGTGSGAFTAPDTANPESWSNFVCLAGGYVENARITAYNSSTHTITANVRNPHSNTVGILQGPACAPYRAISIDDYLANSEQASSYISFGSPDGGANIIVANRDYIIRLGDTPETQNSAFHLVPAAEIVANTAPDVFSGNPQLQAEDNGAVTTFTVGASVWNPHPVNNPEELFSAYDYTGSYNNSSYSSGLFVSGASGPRITGGYQVNYFRNGNDYGMYQHFGGWGSLPTRLSSSGIFSSLVSNDRTPWDNMMSAGSWMPGQTQVNIFNINNNRVTMRQVSGPNNVEVDFSNDGSNSVRVSYLTFPKVNQFVTMHIGVCNNYPFNDFCMGGQVDVNTGYVTHDLNLRLGSLFSYGVVSSPVYQGPATASTGACSVVGWEFSQDGHASFCNGSSWAQKL